jgi:hypothetical protein
MQREEEAGKRKGRKQERWRLPRVVNDRYGEDERESAPTSRMNAELTTH